MAWNRTAVADRLGLEYPVIQGPFGGDLSTTRLASAVSNLGGMGSYGASLADARLVEIWEHVREVGFVEETGFPPENIAFYLEGADFIARNEAQLFLEMSEGRFAEDRAATMLHAVLPLMLDFVGLLRIKSFMKHIGIDGR